MATRRTGISLAILVCLIAALALFNTITPTQVMADDDGADGQNKKAVEKSRI